MEKIFRPHAEILGMQTDTRGALYFVTDGTALVLNEERPAKVIMTVTEGDLYGMNQFLSTVHAGFVSVKAGPLGCSLVVLDKAAVLDKVQEKPALKLSLYRLLFLRGVHRFHNELVVAYGTLWR